jgi:8-oxo-dGTP diphosphatase
MKLACKAIFLSEEKLLLQHRDNNDKIWSPNHWGFFGGMADLKETPETCLIREIKEELQINCEIIKKIHECMHEESNTKNIFFFTNTKDKIINSNLKEGQDFGWFLISEIEKMLITWDTKIFLKFLSNNKLNIKNIKNF